MPFFPVSQKSRARFCADHTLNCFSLSVYLSDYRFLNVILFFPGIYSLSPYCFCLSCFKLLQHNFRFFFSLVLLFSLSLLPKFYCSIEIWSSTFHFFSIYIDIGGVVYCTNSAYLYVICMIQIYVVLFFLFAPFRLVF